MPLYDRFEPYRPLYTPAQQEQVRQATAQLQKLAAAQLGKRVLGGYDGPQGFVADPLVATHIRLAQERAVAQFRNLPVMPEDEDITFRFPELDSVGKYSIIDMKLAHRYLLIQNATQILDPDWRSQFQGIQQAIKADEGFRQIEAQMQDAAKKHRILTRASKLCWSMEGRDMLHRQARELENSPCVVQYELLLRGMEYLVGLRPMEDGLPEEVERLYRNLGLPMPAPRTLKYVRPNKLRIHFQNFDNQLLQRWHADPSHWEADDHMAKEYQTKDICAAVRHYAMATVSCALESVFSYLRGLERQPVDLLFIDDVALGESLDIGEANELQPRQLDGLTTAAIAAALVAGRKVEVLLPDAHGSFSRVPIVKDGYEPKPQKQAIYDAWVQFITRQSMCFGKR